MSAHKSGGGAGRNRAKNQAMAAQMAKDGVKRTSMRCPITHKIVGLGMVWRGEGKRIKG